jgi:hypothetical protein
VSAVRNGRRISEFPSILDTGLDHPFVSKVEVLNRTQNRPVVFDVRWRHLVYEFVADIVRVAMLVCVVRIGVTHPLLEVRLLAFTQSTLGLSFGAMESFLFIMNVLANHNYIWHKSNLHFIQPVATDLCSLDMITAIDNFPRHSGLSNHFCRRYGTARLFRPA